MATIVKGPNGHKTIQFVRSDRKRPSIRLGKMSMRLAKEVKARVEELIASQEAGFSPDAETLDWLSKAGDVLCDRIAAVGLIPRRTSVNLGPFLKAYIDGRTDVSPGAIRNMQQSARYLREHFGAETALRSISLTDAEAFAVMMKSSYAEATAARCIKYARQFWKYAVRARYVSDDIWSHIKAGKMDNSDRQVFVDHDMINRVIDACPDAEWRLIVALARFGGLRVTSELFVLEWDDILWDKNRFIVRAPKTGTRVVPIFPELRPYLQQSYEMAEDGAINVIAIHRNKSLRTRMDKIIMRAGLVPWEKTFQNLRSSRQTELSDQFPEHVVCKWLGNSQAVARAHYNQVIESHFDRAASGAKSGVDSAGDVKSGAPNERTGDHAGASTTRENAGKTGISHELLGAAEAGPVRPEGFDRPLETLEIEQFADEAAQIPAYRHSLIKKTDLDKLDPKTLMALQVRAFLQGDIE